MFILLYIYRKNRLYVPLWTLGSCPFCPCLALFSAAQESENTRQTPPLTPDVYF